jgi:glucose-1-phosphate adenylyltransferase
VRQAARHFCDLEAEYYLILAGDHIYRMDLAEILESHVERDADITIATQPVSAATATGLGVLTLDVSGRIVGFEEKPAVDRLAALGSSAPLHSPLGASTPERPFLASMGIYVFSRDVLHDLLRTNPSADFSRGIISGAIDTHTVHAYLYRGYWADVGTVASFYDVNLMLTRRGSPFNFFHPTRPIYTHPRFLPAARLHDSHVDGALVAEGAYLDTCEVRHSVVGVRAMIQRGARITNSVLLGADTYDERVADPAVGIGPDVVLDRVIVDKNARIGAGARLINEAGIEHLDGDGSYIRSGIIVVPKNGVVRAGTVV